MTVTINDTTMTSDQTAHTARRAPGSEHLWVVSWLPGRPLDRNSTITAMVLADTVDKGGVDSGHRLWPHIEGWAAELGLTGPDAAARVSQPAGESSSSRQQEQDGGRLDPEAAE